MHAQVNQLELSHRQSEQSVDAARQQSDSDLDGPLDQLKQDNPKTNELDQPKSPVKNSPDSSQYDHEDPSTANKLEQDGSRKASSEDF